MKIVLDWNKYIEKAVSTVAEGIVMLKNEKNALPLDMSETVSVFGRIQLHYYKSGTGSGGMVNVSKVTGIVDGLLEAGVRVNTELLDVYRKWDEENPVELGAGWGGEPWSQKEMPLDDEVVRKAASVSSRAIVIIGRTAGEEQDLRIEAGSYLLTDTELDMLRKVRKHFDKRFRRKPAIHKDVVSTNACRKGRFYHAQGCFRLLAHAFHPGFPAVCAVVDILVGFLIAVPELGR